MNWAYRLGWLASRSVLSTYFRGRAFNPERVPAEGPVLLASNHCSFLDPPLIGAALNREVHYLARSTLFRGPTASLLRRWNAHPLDRESGSGAGLRTILEILADGGAVLVFPEGTRSDDGQPLAPEAGVGLIVAKARAPVVPIRVFGTHLALGRRHRAPRPRPVSVKFGRPLDLSAALVRPGESGPRRKHRDVYREIAGKVMDAIAELRPWTDRAEFP